MMLSKQELAMIIHCMKYTLDNDVFEHHTKDLFKLLRSRIIDEYRK